MATDWFDLDLASHHGLTFASVPEATWSDNPEEFSVEEIPAFPFTGHGEHVYLQIEKQERSSDSVASWMARCFQVRRQDVSYAGQKDTRAVTRQWFSIHWGNDPVPDDLLDRLPTRGVRLMAVSRHSHKLRPGQLQGNRFQVTLRLPEGASPAAERTQDALQQLEAHGMPNYFGPQRFGDHRKNAELGRYLLARDETAFIEAYNRAADSPIRKVKELSAYRRRFFVSAYQAYLFNRYLYLRGSRYNHRVPGDLFARGNRSFRDDGSPDLDDQLKTRRSVLTGPIFGPKMNRPSDEAARLEQQILDEEQVDLSAFAGNPLFPRAQGGRRPLYSYPEAPRVVAQPDRIDLTFTLPSGSYATVLVGLLTGSFHRTPPHSTSRR